jgi:hypothetical protein
MINNSLSAGKFLFSKRQQNIRRPWEKRGGFVEFIPRAQDLSAELLLSWVFGKTQKSYDSPRAAQAGSSSAGLGQDEMDGVQMQVSSDMAQTSLY